MTGIASRLGHLSCALCSLALALALLPAAGASGSGQDTSSASSASSIAAIDSGVLSQLNQIRHAHGLVPLALDADLSAAAEQHTRDMVAKGYFAHDSSDGSPFWQRIAHYYPEAAYRYWSVGENLFWRSGPVNAADGLKAWMASPEHRANILDPKWRQIGVAAVMAPDAPGAYDHLGVTVITTDFGVRRST